MHRKDNNGSRASAAASIYKSLMEQGYQAWFPQAGARGVTIVWAKKTHPVLVARHRQPVLIMLDFCQQPNIFSWYTFLSVLEEYTVSILSKVLITRSLCYIQRFPSDGRFYSEQNPFHVSKYHKSNVQGVFFNWASPVNVMRQIHIHNIPTLDWIWSPLEFII